MSELEALTIPAIVSATWCKITMKKRDGAPVFDWISVLMADDNEIEITPRNLWVNYAIDIEKETVSTFFGYDRNGNEWHFKGGEGTWASLDDSVEIVRVTL